MIFRFCRRHRPVLCVFSLSLFCLLNALSCLTTALDTKGHSYKWRAQCCPQSLRSTEFEAISFYAQGIWSRGNNRALRLCDASGCSSETNTHLPPDFRSLRTLSMFLGLHEASSNLACTCRFALRRNLVSDFPAKKQRTGGLSRDVWMKGADRILIPKVRGAKITLSFKPYQRSSCIMHHAPIVQV